jgi:UDP-N-acetylglucosamine 1-carboxyvinyltransferase
MDAFVIQGGRRLRGRIRINGSKNASLPQMAAALLTDEPITLLDVPELSDIANMNRLLESLGCKTEHAEHKLKIHAADPEPVEAHYDIVRTMRASICTLGPLLAKRGKAKVSMPGGCNIGDRPVDLHLRGLKALGAEIHLESGYIIANTPAGGRLIGARVFLGGPFGSTVLGTANVMSAATLATGTTIIECAACEPEVADLADLLNAMGAKITGAGSPRITIEGVDSLKGATHSVIADRIEAGTYIMAAAITNSDVVLENCPTDALLATLDRLDEIGVHVEPVMDELITTTTKSGSTKQKKQSGKGTNVKHNSDGMRQTVRVVTARRFEPVQVVTQPHPGFPTDLQAQIMSLLCLAEGNSIITEKIYPDRFTHVAELARMNASVSRNGPSVLVSGVHHLEGAPVMASDLRASAGLVIAGLAAKGTTTINRVYHIDRGYERMEVTLQKLGAQIERVKQPGG